MPTKRHLAQKQEYLDFVKWLDSNETNTDAFGSYEFCAECNKTKDYPCASAFYKDDSKKSNKA